MTGGYWTGPGVGALNRRLRFKGSHRAHLLCDVGVHAQGQGRGTPGLGQVEQDQVEPRQRGHLRAPERGRDRRRLRARRRRARQPPWPCRLQTLRAASARPDASTAIHFAAQLGKHTR